MFLLKLWNQLSPLPLGRSIFSIILGLKVPYTASICPRVRSLSAGKAVIQMRDRRKVRNHLNSIHAIALINLGEVASGLAVLTFLPPETKAIVTRLEIDYLKKARGTLTATSDFSAQMGGKTLEVKDKQAFEAIAEIRDSAEDIVARVKAQWLVSPEGRA